MPQPTAKFIRKLMDAKFGKRACWFQIQIALNLYAGKDVLWCAPTGAGKSLSFWIPLLIALEEGKDKLMFVVMPLNVLGKQNESILQEAGLPAISVSVENAKEETFNVSFTA